jgi:hypothetical protein
MWEMGLVHWRLEVCVAVLNVHVLHHFVFLVCVEDAVEPLVFVGAVVRVHLVDAHGAVQILLALVLLCENGVGTLLCFTVFGHFVAFVGRHFLKGLLELALLRLALSLAFFRFF